MIFSFVACGDKTLENEGASVNGKLVLGQLGNASLNIDGEVFEDLPPEKQKVTEEASKIYDLKLQPEGNLTATNKNDNSVTKLSLNNVGADKNNGSGSGSGSGKTNGGGPSNSNPPTRAKCSQCGGSGFTNYMTNVYDPVTGGYRMQTVSGVCPSCHGTGYR